MNRCVDIDEIRDWVLDTIDEAGFDESEFSFIGIRAYGSGI